MSYFDDPDYNEGVERGCGVRTPGGIYAVCPLGPGGRPVEDFLCDPPRRIDGLDVPNRGVALLERPDGSGLYDIYDRVGESGYPNVADMVEEIKRFGLSRRLGKQLDFSLLTPGSLIILIHPKAIIENAEDLYDALTDERDANPERTHPYTCPCGKVAHKALPGFLDDATDRPMCAGLWWEDIRKGDASFDPAAAMRTVERESGSTHYTARQAPHEFDGVYSPGIFARFPVTRLEIVEDPDGDGDWKAHDRADLSSLPILDVKY